jgi:hypothetical protein
MADKGIAVNRALEERCEAVTRLLARADFDEIGTRYKVGVHVARVRDEKGTYGDRAVERMAAKVHRDPTTLYRAAVVTDVWSWRELRALSRRMNRDANPLSWSHWVELTRVSTSWHRWHARTLEEAWSVRVLASEVDATLAKERTTSAGVAADTTEAALADTLRGVRRFGTEVAGALEAVLDRIERATPRDRPKKVPELLACALDLIEDAHAKTGVLAARVRRLSPPRELSKVGSPTVARES